MITTRRRWVAGKAAADTQIRGYRLTGTIYTVPGFVLIGRYRNVWMRFYRWTDGWRGGSAYRSLSLAKEGRS